MGMTIILGQKIGEKKADEGGEIIGSGLLMFLSIGIVLTLVLPLFATQLATTMHAPTEAFDLTVHYIRICGGGAVIIIAYNLIGGVFRGIHVFCFVSWDSSTEWDTHHLLWHRE